MSKKNIFFVGISLFYILYLIFPIFSRLLPAQIPCLIVSSFLLFLFPQTIIYNKTFVWFLLYVVATFLFFAFGRWLKIDIGACKSYTQLIVEYGFLLPNIMISIILLNLREKKVFKIIGLSTISMMCISYVIVLPQLQYMDLRSMALNNDESENYVGLINYTLLHAYVFVIPPMFYCTIFFKGKMKVFLLLALLLTIYIILKSSITTTIILLVLDLLFFIGYNSKHKEKAFIYIGSGMIFSLLFFYSGLLEDLLESIRPFFANTAVEEKIDSFQMLLSTGQSTGSIETREELHDISIDSFLENPLIGGGRFGGHSSILDRMAVMGLVGFVPYIMIYFSIFNQWKRRFNATERIYYYVAFISVLVFLYTKGVFGQEGNLFFMVLLPVLLLLPMCVRLSKNA